MKTNVPVAALAPHWPDGQLKPRCRPSGNLDLVYSIGLGGSEILKIIYPSNLKSKSQREAVVNSKHESDLASIIMKVIELKSVSKSMKTQFDKEKQISHELRKQYSLILLRFKLAERKVYPNSCEIRIIVEEPSGSPKKQIDLGSEDSESIEDSDQEVSGISKETKKKEESVKNK